MLDKLMETFRDVDKDVDAANKQKNINTGGVNNGGINNAVDTIMKLKKKDCPINFEKRIYFEDTGSFCNYEERSLVSC